MKVEKINNNKVQITLTFEELENREIDIKEIEKNSDVAKNLFINLIEESNIDEEFELDNSQLLIEASSDSNNLFVLTITKIDNIPDLRKYSLLDKKSTKRSRDKTYTYKVESYIFSFKKLDDILDLCQSAKPENLFFGKNTLYKYNDKYFIIFSNSSVKNKKFLKTFVFLSEYCDNYYSYDILSSALKEKAKIVIANKALQTLSKI